MLSVRGKRSRHGIRILEGVDCSTLLEGVSKVSRPLTSLESRDSPNSIKPMNLAAVTIAKDYVTWQLTGVEHLVYTDGYEDKWTEVEKPKSLERVSYLAERRNNAVRE